MAPYDKVPVPYDKVPVPYQVELDKVLVPYMPSNYSMYGLGLAQPLGYSAYSASLMDLQRCN